jgi:hypothetical protein
LTVAARGEEGCASSEFEQEPAWGLEGEFKGGEGAVCELDVPEGFDSANQTAGAGLVGGRGGEKVEEGEENGLGLLVGGGSGGEG